MGPSRWNNVEWGAPYGAIDPGVATAIIESGVAVLATGAQIAGQVSAQKAMERQQAADVKRARREAAAQERLMESQARADAARAAALRAQRGTSAFAQPAVVLGVIGVLGVLAIVIVNKPRTQRRAT